MDTTAVGSPASARETRRSRTALAVAGAFALLGVAGAVAVQVADPSATASGAPAATARPAAAAEALRVGGEATALTAGRQVPVSAAGRASEPAKRAATLPPGGSGAATGTAPAARSQGPAAAGLEPGGYQVQVLGQGWDARGRYLLVDLGSIVLGEAAEPGVDGTRPLTFETGSGTQQQRVDLADDHSMLFNRDLGGSSYGPGGWADLVTAIDGRSERMLADMTVDRQGRFTSLVEPYRP